MANFYCFIDESFDENIFVLGGIFIEEQNLSEILLSWQEFKQSIGLEKTDPIKWSLGDRGDEKSIKSKIKTALSSEKDWLTSFRMCTLAKIASLDIKLVASLHQDVRWYKKISSNSHISTVEFYLWGFNFLLQRIWWQVKDKKNVQNVFIILDKPPESKKFKGSETRICKSYQDACENGFHFDDSSISPLREYCFFESIFFAKSDFHSFIQIADFCIGAIRTRAKDLMEGKSDTLSKEFLKKLINLFYKTEERDIVGKGLVVFPKDQELHRLIINELIRIFDEIDKDKCPF